MTISIEQYTALGARIYTPEGPFGSAGNTPLGSQALGTVTRGDAGGEFIFLQFIVEASVTMNQGDFLVWDCTFDAVQSNAAASFHTPGSNVGTFFLGGRFGDPGANISGQGDQWSYTFAPGVYGIWAQRSGCSLANYTGGITAQGDTSFTTSTAGALGALASAGTHGATVPNVFSCLATIPFTGTTTNASAIITAVSSAAGNGVKGLRKGMALASGSGVPAGAYIVDISGSTVTMSAAATSGSSGASLSAYNGAFWATFANASKVMSAASLYGVYPNATLSGTGVGSSAVINSITGIPGAYTVNVSVASSSAESTPVLVTASNYVEAMLTWPYISVQS